MQQFSIETAAPHGSHAVWIEHMLAPRGIGAEHLSAKCCLIDPSHFEQTRRGHLYNVLSLIPKKTTTDTKLAKISNGGNGPAPDRS